MLALVLLIVVLFSSPAGPVVTPTPCPVGHYCEVIIENGVARGAIEPIKCPLGYKMYDGSIQSTFDDTCEPWRPGYYGNHADRIECNPCRAGVVCMERATTDMPLTNDSIPFGYNMTRSYPCPRGRRRVDCSSKCSHGVYPVNYSTGCGPSLCSTRNYCIILILLCSL